MILKLMKRGAAAARTAAKIGAGLITGPGGVGYGVSEYEDFQRLRQEAAAQDRAEGVSTEGSDMDAIAEGTVEMSAEDLRIMMEIEEGDDLPLLIDVRQDHEWKAGHIGGAVHIPLGELDQRLGEVDRDRLVVVYCHSGMRSIDGSYVLKRHDYPQVRSLAGGIVGWQEGGNSTEIP
jgi:rhodanese-related sulfurtransferase